MVAMESASGNLQFGLFAEFAGTRSTFKPTGHVVHLLVDQLSCFGQASGIVVNAGRSESI